MNTPDPTTPARDASTWSTLDRERVVQALEAEQAAARQDAEQKSSTADRTFALAALQPKDAELAALLTTGTAFIRCGGCDFLASSQDQEQNRLAFQDHECPAALEDAGQRRPLASYVFSLNGFLVAAVLAPILIYVLYLIASAFGIDAG